MSFQAINWALSLKGRSAPVNHILLLLANCAHATTWEAFPSIKCLVSWSGLDRKTVIPAIKRLVASGLIVNTGRKVGRTGQVIVYQLMPSSDYVKENLSGTQIGTVVNGIESQKRSNRGPNFRQKSANFSHQESQIRDTEPSLNLNRSYRKQGADDRDVRLDFSPTHETLKKLALLFPDGNPEELTRQFNAYRRGKAISDFPQKQFLEWAEKRASASTAGDISTEVSGNISAQILIPILGE